MGIKKKMRQQFILTFAIPKARYDGIMKVNIFVKNLFLVVHRQCHNA